MKRVAVFLLLASCTAFESGTAGDAPAPKSPSADAGPNAEGGGATVVPEGGASPDAQAPAELDSGGPRTDPTPLAIDALSEWHDLGVSQIKIPLPYPRPAGDLVIAVVNTDSAGGGATVNPLPNWTVVGGSGAGTMATSVLSHTLDGTEPNQIPAALNVAANVSVLVAVYHGASGVSAGFNPVSADNKLSLPSPARPAALPDDMLFLVYAGVVSTGDITFSVPQGFEYSDPYVMTNRSGFGANARNGDLSSGAGFVSAVTRSTASTNDAVATLVHVKD